MHNLQFNTHAMCASVLYAFIKNIFEVIDKSSFINVTNK